MVDRYSEEACMQACFEFKNVETNPYYILDHTEWKNMYENYLGIKQQLVYEHLKWRKHEN